MIYSLRSHTPPNIGTGYYHSQQGSIPTHTVIPDINTACADLQHPYTTPYYNQQSSILYHPLFQDSISVSTVQLPQEDLHRHPQKLWTLTQTNLSLFVCSTSLLKTIWEKKKFLIITNVSYFPNSVFCRFVELSVNFIEFKSVVSKLYRWRKVQKLSLGKEADCFSRCFCLF